MAINSIGSGDKPLVQVISDLKAQKTEGAIQTFSAEDSFGLESLLGTGGNSLPKLSESSYVSSTLSSAGLEALITALTNNERKTAVETGMSTLKAKAAEQKKNRRAKAG